METIDTNVLLKLAHGKNNTSSSSDRFIQLIRRYVSAAVYWCLTRQSFEYTDCFVTFYSFYIN